MSKYLLGRIVRSLVSIFIVVTIAIVMVYTMIPRNNVFTQDPTITKLGGKPDEKVRYKYNVWEKLGYLEFDEQKDMCAKSDDYSACMIVGSAENKKVAQNYEADGWSIGYYPISGFVYAYRDYTIFQLVFNWYGNLIHVDHPWKINDANNSDLERSLYIGTDEEGVVALKCSGCESKYQIYFDTSFPFIHQNIISIHFGTSYPTFDGKEVISVINDGQGTNVSQEVTFDTGVTTKSPINIHSCKYKPTSTLDKLDNSKFTDNYANCENNLKDPSMMLTSMIFGILGLIISYAIGLPAGVYMASKKDKVADKIGIVYINFMIAVPSLAFIYFAKFLGSGLSLPDKFPVLGFGDIRSYILPVVILGLLSTASLMIWVRRYMIDQASSDYVKFARAKGLSQNEIFRTHIMRNAIIPIVQGIPSSVILTISGAVITETVFAIPGMGKMLPDSITAYNNPMIIALTFIFTSLSIFSLLLGDILVTLVDPRIKLDDQGGSR